jgi:hypothetical protein
MKKEKLEYKTLKDLFVELDEHAEELIDFGNSKEKAKGSGMKTVTKAIYEYCKKNKIILHK